MTHPDEMTARKAVVARLLQRFPDAFAPSVAAAVAGGFDRYAHARVRDFVGLLVEREVAAELRAGRSHDVRWHETAVRARGEGVAQRIGDRRSVTL